MKQLRWLPTELMALAGLTQKHRRGSMPEMPAPAAERLFQPNHMVTWLPFTVYKMVSKVPSLVAALIMERLSTTPTAELGHPTMPIGLVQSSLGDNYISLLDFI